MTVFASKVLQFCASPETKFLCFRLLFITVLGVVVYGNTFSVPFSFDDAVNLQGNPVVQNLSVDGIRDAFRTRRAFGILTFQLNYFISGWNLFWFHCTNLAIHISAALTLYYFVSVLLKTPYAAKSSFATCATAPFPFFVAILFVVHPVQTQAVTYIVQRFTSLATLLYLAALVSYVKLRLLQHASGRYISFHTVRWGFSLLLLSLLALKTKEIAYTLPAAIIMTELMFFNCSRKKLLGIVSVTITLAALVVCGYLVGGRSIDTVVTALDETTRVQTITSRSDYLFTQFRVIMTYIRLIFWPVNQSIDYDYVLSHSLFEWRVMSSLLAILLMIAVAAWMIRKSGSTYPQLRLVAFGILWFFLTLAVESSFLPIIDLIFEHRVYLPSVGAFIAITAGILSLWQRDEHVRQKLCLTVLCVALVLGLTTWNRNNVWRSEISLWEDATGKNPNSARGWNNLGGAYIKKKESLKALQAVTRSIELDPSKADAWNNLGIAIDIMGVYNDRFHRTVEMFNDPAATGGKVVNKWLGEVHNNLGLAYEILGNLPKAAENYRNAIGYNPALTLAYYNLAIVSAVMRDFGKYSEQLQILMLIDPTLAERLRVRTGVRD